eukprot:7574210-Prorocentrum_lima.AAC.1
MVTAPASITSLSPYQPGSPCQPTPLLPLLLLGVSAVPVVISADATGAAEGRQAQGAMATEYWR